MNIYSPTSQISVKIVNRTIKPIQIDAPRNAKHGTTRRILPKRPSRPTAHLSRVLNLPFGDPEICLLLDLGSWKPLPKRRRSVNKRPPKAGRDVFDPSVHPLNQSRARDVVRRLNIEHRRQLAGDHLA
jgi:hypothetical protein